MNLQTLRIALGKKPVKFAFRILFITGALILLAWLLHKIGLEKVGHALRKVGFTGFAVLCFFGFIENLGDAASLRAATLGRVNLYRILSYSGIGTLVNTIMPGEIGEVVKGTLIKRHAATSDAISSTVVWNYVFKLSRPLVACAAAVTAWILGHGVDPHVATIVLLATILAFLPYFALRLVLRRGFSEWIVKLLIKIRILKKDPQAIIDSAKKIDHQITQFHRNHPRHYAQVFLFQLIARLASWFTLYLTTVLMGLDFSFGLCALVYAGFSVGSYIVMMLPARLGVTESAGYLIFSLYGLDGASGLIVYIILRIKALLTHAVPAIFSPR